MLKQCLKVIIVTNLIAIRALHLFFSGLSHSVWPFLVFTKILFLIADILPFSCKINVFTILQVLLSLLMLYSMQRVQGLCWKHRPVRIPLALEISVCSSLASKISVPLSGSFLHKSVSLLFCTCTKVERDVSSIFLLIACFLVQYDEFPMQLQTHCVSVIIMVWLGKAEFVSAYLSILRLIHSHHLELPISLHLLQRKPEMTSRLTSGAKCLKATVMKVSFLFPTYPFCIPPLHPILAGFIS